MIDLIKKLRRQTGASLSDIKQALEQSGGDEAQARKLLIQLGAAKAAHRIDRQAGSGLIEAYVHAGRIGVLVELGCETDFVAQSSEFRTFAHDLALQIASMNPPDVESLLAQEFIKDTSKTIGDLLNELVGKIGEKIEVKRLVRYEIRK